MILYLLKSTVCLTILWGIYKLFLEPEKMHVFNRFYLLVSLVFAFTIPLVNIEIESSGKDNMAVLASTLAVQPATLYEANLKATFITTPRATSWSILMNLASGLISMFFLIRFIHNLISIYKKIKEKTLIKWQGATLVLLEEKTLPYTFLNYIFINKAYYENSRIEPELFSHELAHVRQQHSLDVLLLEVLRILFWFNPMLYLFKQAIQLNHEFLADEAVNTAYQDIKAYQYLLLSKATQACGLSLTSNLNFQITKKRLIMMTKVTSQSMALMKKAVCIPLFVGLFFCIANFQSIAQKPTILKLSPPEITLKLKPHVLTKEDVNYQNGEVLIRSKSVFPQQKKYKELSAEEKNMPMTVMYFQKEVPSSEDMVKWEDSKMYGVWLNSKRIPNSALSKYKASDIAHYFVSKLAKNAVNYGKHYFQIDLMTNDYYDNVYLKGVKESPLLMLDLGEKKADN